MFYRVFESIRIAQGYGRSCLYDLDRNDYLFLDNQTASILESNRQHLSITFSEEMLNYFLKNEWVFESTSEDGFSNLCFSFQSPFLISNITIDLTILGLQKNTLETLIYTSFFSQRYCVNCYDKKSMISLLNFFKHKKWVSQFELRLPEVIYEDIIDDYLFIDRTLVFNSMENKAKTNPNLTIWQKKPLEKIEQVNVDSFEVNLSLFSESQKHHTYFNQKLYIGSKGEIKNAPECEEEFGSIQDLKDSDQLKNLISQPDFQKYWYVHKELCDVCKDCEFRHMCVDNRLPYQRDGEAWYHKEECNYNPYICKWKGEEGYKTLQECGIVSNEKWFQINHEKIAKINQELWGE